MNRGGCLLVAWPPLFSSAFPFPRRPPPAALPPSLCAETGLGFLPRRRQVRPIRPSNPPPNLAVSAGKICLASLIPSLLCWCRGKASPGRGARAGGAGRRGAASGMASEELVHKVCQREYAASSVVRSLCCRPNLCFCSSVGSL